MRLAIRNAHITRRIAKPAPVVRRIPQSTYSPAAHWQNTWWAISAVGVLWMFAGCRKVADGGEA